MEDLLSLMALLNDEMAQVRAKRTRRIHSAVFKAYMTVAVMGG